MMVRWLLKEERMRATDFRGVSADKNLPSNPLFTYFTIHQWYILYSDLLMN